MSEEFRDNGRDCKCPICGKEWHVNDVNAWACKKETGGRKSRMIYFCKMSHKWKWEEDLIAREIEEAKASDKKNCIKCRYFYIDEYGFYNCSATAIVVSPAKLKCAKYKEKAGDGNGTD